MKNIRKVVYLDEQAVVDYLELANDGEESIVMKKISETVGNVEAEGAVGKVFLDWPSLN